MAKKFKKEKKKFKKNNQQKQKKERKERKEKKDFKANKEKNREDLDNQKEANKADFYLDDEDADLAYDSSELEEKESKEEMEENSFNEEEEEMSEHGSELDFKEEDYIPSDSEEKEEKKKMKAMTTHELKKLMDKVNEGNEIYITKFLILTGKLTNPESEPNFEEGENEVTIKQGGDVVCRFGVKKTTEKGDGYYTKDTFSFEMYELGEEPQEPENEEKDDNNDKELFIKLVGAFDSKMVGEEEIDAVSSATTTTYVEPESSNVVLMAALAEKGTDANDIPSDSWNELSFFNQGSDQVWINEDPTKTKIIIEPECPGITAQYNIFKGIISLKGKPSQAGKYKVSVQFTDTQNRTAVSNAVDFEVFGLEEKLSDKLIYENCTNTPDGKYIYDQEPWLIREFGTDNEEVTVPKDIKAWYGSHELGTYSEIGKIISLTNGEEPFQTLIIPDGCDLTLVNLRIHSGVKVIVKDGGKLSLRQSTLEGIAEIENGGTFSCDYSGYGSNGKFIFGSAVNGQIVLKDGSTIENARIISHANYSARDDEKRINQNPIVVVDGNVNVKGDVYILADEAPTGSYGQTALLVKGTLNIPEDSNVAVYGGGRSHLTARGGDAIVLDGGTIRGEGAVIAVGGFGFNITSDRSLLGGGAAVSGNGTINARRLFAEGGYSFDTQTKAISGNVAIGDGVFAKIGDGITTIGDTSSYYWSGTGDRYDNPYISMYFTDEEIQKSRGERNEGTSDTGSEVENPAKETTPAEENKVTKETKPTEENKAAKETKPAEENKAAKETKPAEGNKVTKDVKPSEENKVTKETKTSEENKVTKETRTVEERIAKNDDEGTVSEETARQKEKEQEPTTNKSVNSDYVVTSEAEVAGAQRKIQLASSAKTNQTSTATVLASSADSNGALNASLLDNNNTGIIISGINGREEARTYAKPIVNGDSVQYKLTKEEEKLMAPMIKSKYRIFNDGMQSKIEKVCSNR